MKGESWNQEPCGDTNGRGHSLAYNEAKRQIIHFAREKKQEYALTLREINDVFRD